MHATSVGGVGRAGLRSLPPPPQLQPPGPHRFAPPALFSPPRSPSPWTVSSPTHTQPRVASPQARATAPPGLEPGRRSPGPPPSALASRPHAASSWHAAPAVTPEPLVDKVEVQAPGSGPAVEDSERPPSPQQPECRAAPQEAEYGLFSEIFDQLGESTVEPEPTAAQPEPSPAAAELPAEAVALEPESAPVEPQVAALEPELKPEPADAESAPQPVIMAAAPEPEPEPMAVEPAAAAPEPEPTPAAAAPEPQQAPEPAAEPATPAPEKGSEPQPTAQTVAELLELLETERRAGAQTAARVARERDEAMARLQAELDSATEEAACARAEMEAIIAGGRECARVAELEGMVAELQSAEAAKDAELASLREGGASGDAAAAELERKVAELEGALGRAEGQLADRAAEHERIVAQHNEAITAALESAKRQAADTQARVGDLAAGPMVRAPDAVQAVESRLAAELEASRASCRAKMILLWSCSRHVWQQVLRAGQPSGEPLQGQLVAGFGVWSEWCAGEVREASPDRSALWQRKLAGLKKLIKSECEQLTDPSGLAELAPRAGACSGSSLEEPELLDEWLEFVSLSKMRQITEAERVAAEREKEEESARRIEELEAQLALEDKEKETLVQAEARIRQLETLLDGTEASIT